MQALPRLSFAVVPLKSSLISLQTFAPVPSIVQNSWRHYASDIKKEGKDGTNWVTDGVKATVGEVGKKAKEAMGYQKKVGHETQEPAGVMENRDADGSNQPQSRYDALADAAKGQQGGTEMTDHYAGANKSANAIADKGKAKAEQHAKSKS